MRGFINFIMIAGSFVIAVLAGLVVTRHCWIAGFVVMTGVYLGLMWVFEEYFEIK